MNCMIYMRASTKEQDASRAEEELKTFATTNGLTICGWYRENISGTQLERPQLNQLLNDATGGSVLLIEKLDRLSRLTRSEWEQLKERIRAKRLRIVCCDIPTTLQVLQGDQPVGSGGFDVRAIVLDALNSMLLDIAAAWARDDYDTRKKRQAQGIKKAKEAGKYRGKPRDEALRQKIAELLDKGITQRRAAELLGCARSTVQAVAKERQ